MKSREAQKLRSGALFFVVLVVMPLLLFACSSAKSVQNNEIYHDSTTISVRCDSTSHQRYHWQDIQQHDSVSVHDSVLVYAKGDTIYKERWHKLTTIKWKSTTKMDSTISKTYTSKADTIKIKYYVNRWKTKEVEKSDSTWKKVRLFFGDVFILFIALLIICYIKERITSARKIQ